MKLATALVVASVALGAQAAQVPVTSPMVLGQGALSCSSWLAGVAKPSPDTDQVSWTLGYLSAIAAADASLRPVTAAYVRGAVEGYCNRNPAATIEAATKSIVASLKTTR